MTRETWERQFTQKLQQELGLTPEGAVADLKLKHELYPQLGLFSDSKQTHELYSSLGLFPIKQKIEITK